MNIEHQEHPAVSPDQDWIEIDHASAAVDDEPSIYPEVMDFFELIIDPVDDRNKWLRPAEGVVMIGRVSDLELNEDCIEVYRLRLPDGREACLIYELETGSYTEYWLVRMEFPDQLTLAV